MGQSASQAATFYREVAASGRLWTVQDAGGFPAPKNSNDQRAQPFWSSLARTQKIIRSIPAYAGFEPVELEWSVFQTRWIPDLSNDGILVGVNWSGPRAIGYDVEPEQVAKNVQYYREKRS